MNTSVEDRLRDYTRRIDDAIDEYAARTPTRAVPTAFLKSPEPDRRRAGGRRLVAAVAVCVIACATVGVVVAQRDPQSRTTATQPAPAPTTTAGLHTIDGKTFGPMPDFGPGTLTLQEYARIPDYVSVTWRDREGLAGYVKKSDLYPVVNGHILPGGPIMPVYADGGSPLVGHFYECKGFVPLGTDPATISNAGCTTTTVKAAPPPTDRTLDLDRASAFGFAPGQRVDPDTVRAAVSRILGPPTRDTGWYVTKSSNQDDCIGGMTQRILRWGSLSYAFWRESNPTLYVLWSWTLGDSRAANWGDRHEPHPIVDKPVVATTTAAGIGVGSTLDALRRAFGSRLVGVTATSASINHPDSPDLDFELKDGTVTGIAGVLPFC